MATMEPSYKTYYLDSLKDAWIATSNKYSTLQNAINAINGLPQSEINVGWLVRHGDWIVYRAGPCGNSTFRISTRHLNLIGE